MLPPSEPNNFMLPPPLAAQRVYSFGGYFLDAKRDYWYVAISQFLLDVQTSSKLEQEKPNLCIKKKSYFVVAALGRKF